MNILMLGLGDAGWEDPAGEQVLRHKEYARRAGVSIDLIIDSPVKRKYAYGDVRVHFTGAPRWQYLATVESVARKIFLERKPDLVAAQDPFGTALAGLRLKRKYSLPLLIQNHSSFLFNFAWLAEKPFLFSALHLLAQYVLPRADGWRVVNSREKEIYVHTMGLPEGRIRVLPVPCDLAPFEAKELPSRAKQAREKFHIGSDAPMVLWAGRPVRVKRLPLLLESFARVGAAIPEAMLVLAADKRSAQEDVDGIAKRNGVFERVIWTGNLPRRELAEVFAASDVFVFSSAYEGFGRVLVEAGAAGIPSVSTATAGAQEIVIDGETGFLVRSNSPEDFADPVVRLLRDSTLRENMGAAARRRVSAVFNPDQAYDAIVNQWREMAQSGLRTP